MEWALAILVATQVGLLAIAEMQRRLLLRARREAILLTLAWRSPESVAGRDLLPQASPALKYELLNQMVAKGEIEAFEWGHKVVDGVRYKQFRYRLHPSALTEIDRPWH